MCVARCVCLLRVECRFLVTVFMHWELYCSLFVACCLQIVDGCLKKK